MKYRSWIALAALVLATCGVAPALSGEKPAAIRNRGVSEYLDQAPSRVLGVERDANGTAIWTAVRRFYERRRGRLAWLGRSAPEPAAGELLAALRNADQEGLRSRQYHPDQLERELRRAYSSKVRVDREALDVLLTDMCLRYAFHLSRGRVDPTAIELAWYGSRRQADLAASVASALEQEDLGRVLADLSPAHSDYARLREILERYRNIARAGGWPLIPKGPSLRPDDFAPVERIKPLQDRLIDEGYLDPAEAAFQRPGLVPASRERRDWPPSLPEREQKFLPYDTELANAVGRFQRHHGIEVDGIVGPATRREMNVSAEQRARQIALNMERWRWLPEHMGEQHIRVNVPAYQLAVYEDSHAVLSMGVIVGKQGWGTPLFSDTMRLLILNPYWNVPESIAVDDILPKLRRDPGYLERNNFVVFTHWGRDAVRVDPSDVDWARVSDGELSYRFRQDPGPSNPLGRIKFVFPNPFQVYFHDTPKKQLFKRTARAFSHGCIRVEQPLSLALRLLRSDPRWTREHLREAIDSGEHQALRLPKPVPVYVLYWTAFTDDSGAAEFRPDMYGVDAALAQALREASAGGAVRMARLSWEKRGP